MLLVVIILLVSFILIPLVELTLKEQALFFCKLLVYVLSLAYILWVLVAGHTPL